ncbi:dynein heavy chain 5, axonemal isoform X2 [Silurus asotus]|uniref:Dynein heavy chain 5, axonemal isoform X2 n=1 Tax=Silurus asotus TaxID=30991 RepID=A0AAD5FBT7_SILAS|nr:dynein heavy chain 5, axonemal isoform X2 [Silurus asotus]
MENFKQARENRQSLLTASHQYLINVLASVLSLEESVAEEFILDSPSEISFFTLNALEGVLKGQQDLLSKVYLPAIGATEDWGILTNTEEEGKIKQDFTDVVSNYIKFIDETRTMLECSQLSEPSDIDFSTLVTLDDMKAAGADADIVRKCEEVLMVWCSEIDEVLTKSEIQKEDETAGIVTEIEQWKNMASKFSSINEQMKGTKIQTVLNFLLVIESKKMKIWQSMETRLMEHLKNAKDNIKLLSVLEKNCQPLYNFDPVTNLLLTGCKAYITNNGSAQIWDQDPEIIIKKIEDCVGLFREYQSCFHKIKEEILEQMPEGKIEVFEKPIFGKFERFCKRLQQISEMFTVVKTFSSLNQSKIERIDILAQKFQDICTNMKKNQENALDHGKKEFEVEFAEFMLQINNLTVELEDFIRKRISESGPNAVNLLQRFQNLNMPCLEAEISKNYNLILKRQALELEHVKEHFHGNKDDPPLVRNMPPVAGRILWVRNLLSKIEEPIRNIQVNIQTRFTNQMTLT